MHTLPSSAIRCATPKGVRKFNDLTKRLFLNQTQQKHVEQRAAAPIASDATMLARRYASALYDLATEREQVDAVAKDLTALRDMVHNSPEFRLAATQPRMARAEMTKAMQAIAVSAGLNKLTGNFLALLAQKQRLSILTVVVHEFLAEMADKRGEFTADVRTARPLSPTQTEQLAARMKDMMGGKVHMDVRQDAGLLGGLTIRVGSKLIDASLKTRLERLGRHLKSSHATPQTLAAHKGAA